MVQFFKELQATDHFEIILPHALSTNERQLVTLFYQPLTGAEPISLYLTLWAEAEYAETKEMTHYYLMNVLSMSARQVFEARIALEAIGLLRTFRQDIGVQRKFIYELIRPLDALSFFNDPLLSMFLYSKIGEQPYRKLRQRFLAKPSKEGYQEVTRSFIDVFKPVHTNVPQDLYDTQKQKQQDYPFYYDQFDFALLKAGLSEQLVPANALTTEARELIAKLAFLYQLTPLDMQKVVIISLDDDMRLPAERLKKAAADYYKLTISKEAPKLAKTFTEPVPQTEQLTKEQELLHYLETTPPIQVLRDINKGKEPIPASIELAEQLMTTYGMPTGVVNVLLEYVMLSTDMKLPRKYVEQIADHWNRKNLQTAKEAMDLARTERDKYAQWKSDSATKQAQPVPRKQYNKKNNARDEKVPEWFYKRDEQQEEPVASDIDFEKERQKILQKLGQQEK
ncbi:MAG: DnaD domain protein [Solibacillus sp.]